MAARARELARADGLGGNLTRQVDLDAGVDGAHLVVLCHHGGVVGIFKRHEVDAGVFGEVVDQLLAARGKAADQLASVQRLFAAVDNAGQAEVCHGGGDHLGVDAKVLFAHEGLGHGVGDGADAELDGRAVLHQGGDVLADGAVHVGQGAGVEGVDGVCLFDDVVDVVNGNLGVAVDGGGQGVDAGDDDVGHVDGASVRAAERRAHIAVTVHHGGAENVDVWLIDIEEAVHKGVQVQGDERDVAGRVTVAQGLAEKFGPGDKLLLILVVPEIGVVLAAGIPIHHHGLGQTVGDGVQLGIKSLEAGSGIADNGAVGHQGKEFFNCSSFGFDFFLDSQTDHLFQKIQLKSV